MKRMMLEVSTATIAPVTQAKLDTVARFVVGPATDLTYLVTEAAVPEERLAPYRALGLSIIIG